jgi:hypothetical protein
LLSAARVERARPLAVVGDGRHASSAASTDLRRRKSGICSRPGSVATAAGASLQENPRRLVAGVWSGPLAARGTRVDAGLVAAG